MRFDTVLIANRGEIARRIIRSCRQQGYRSVAVFSDADEGAAFVHEADEAVRIGPAPSRESYLSIERIIAAAKRVGAQAIHPGYGFLAENAEFAAACEEAGLIFVGPRSETIRTMGSKIESKKLMESYGVPVIPGYFGEDQSVERLLVEAARIEYPVLLKASAGGGGKGMRIVASDDELATAIPAARREALSAFGDDTLFLEKVVSPARHVELQILGDEEGHLVHVFERECSIQRRHQKIIEETPSVALDAELRAEMGAAAVRAGEAMGYCSAGTVEFLLGANRRFYFLEVNTRLQVEHPVTEMTTGLDLVELQLEIAQGHPLPFAQRDLRQRGHAIECRIYSENPANHFLPATGRLADWHLPTLDGLRVDSGVERGDEVSIHYDPLLAKVITWGKTRNEATRRMIRALDGASIQGVTTNRAFLIDILRHEAWERGELDTRFIERHYGAEGWSES
ncbi:MAG: ATP-grasp domain-containing protein, partial [Myxococcales bacterium]|nr:ATP-grasp domain-containing protein [Myxococcales bacterium]